MTRRVLTRGQEAQGKNRNPVDGGTVKSYMKNAIAYGPTEDTEKHSVSSRKKIKSQRHREVDNRLVGRLIGVFPHPLIL